MSVSEPQLIYRRLLYRVLCYPKILSNSISLINQCRVLQDSIRERLERIAHLERELSEAKHDRDHLHTELSESRSAHSHLLQELSTTRTHLQSTIKEEQNINQTLCETLNAREAAMEDCERELAVTRHALEQSVESEQQHLQKAKEIACQHELLEKRWLALKDAFVSQGKLLRAERKGLQERVRRQSRDLSVTAATLPLGGAQSPMRARGIGSSMRDSSPCHSATKRPYPAAKSHTKRGESPCKSTGWQLAELERLQDQLEREGEEQQQLGDEESL